MIILKELCHKLDCRIFNDANIKISGIATHSQRTKKGNLFVVIEGYQTSGKLYVEAAIKNGAIAVATKDKSLIKSLTKKYPDLTLVYVKNPRQFLAEISNRFYDYPSKKLALIGITGTDGKTTASYMIKSILEAAGKKTGLIGTIKYYDGKKWSAAANTTPDSLDFNAFLNNLVKRKIRYCISEVSSHALALDRTYGLDFKVSVFTNLTQDHLDFHKTIQAYGEAKLKLFKNLKPLSYAVINKDDKFARKILSQTKAKIITYSLNHDSDLSAKVKTYTKDGINVNVYFNRASRPLNITLPMLGLHNVYNMLAAIGTAQALGISNQYIKAGLEKLATVPGRLEWVRTNKGFDIYIDYAHTAKALATAIKTLKQITSGRTIVVFGCGGNRDRKKRPVMGKVATQMCDYAIITSDNPRSEKPVAIINEIIKGIKGNNYDVLPDRAQAIKQAMKIARPTDTLLIAGKGHETYQIIRNKQIHFSDKEVVNKAIRKK